MAVYSPEQIVVSCEHGGRSVPGAYQHLFAGAEHELGSHRAWDEGSAEVAIALGEVLTVTPVIARITRLLVDLNRSPGHPRQFSQFTRRLPLHERQRLVADYYLPHRQRVESLVREAVRHAGSALHISVHTFTPVLGGKLRTADVALLYDPSRATERVLCNVWARMLAEARPDLRIRRNYPYKGVSDGLTTFLRKRFSEARYQGVELEVNQRWVEIRENGWRDLVSSIAYGTRDALLGPRESA